METLLLFLSLSLSIHLSIYLSVPPFGIHLSIHLRRPSLLPSPPPPRHSISFSPVCLSLSASSSFSVGPALLSLPNGETVSSCYSWGSRIARGLVTRLRTHLLLARQLGPSVHQATILLISARIGSVAKCFQDYQFTMARGELRGAPPAPKTMQNVAYVYDVPKSSNVFDFFLSWVRNISY